MCRSHVTLHNSQPPFLNCTMVNLELNGLIEVYSRASTQAADEKSSKAYFNVSIQVNFNVGRSDCKGPKAAVRTGIRG